MSIFVVNRGYRTTISGIWTDILEGKGRNFSMLAMNYSVLTEYYVNIVTDTITIKILFFKTYWLIQFLGLVTMFSWKKRNLT